MDVTECSSPRMAPPPELSVATWNLQRRHPTEVGLPELVSRFAPDVLLLQEADGPGLEANAAAGYAHRLLRADAGYPPGMAILSRHPILRTGELPDPSPGTGRSRLIWARLALDGVKVLVGAFHVAAPVGDPRTENPWHRGLHLRAVAAFATRLAAAGIPTIIGGDCNTIRFVIPGYTDVAADSERLARTWRPVGGWPWIPAVARLDRIFVSSGVDVVATATACGLSRSDHCPVITRLRLDTALQS